MRLADVIGPYDDSCRFWKYLIWAKIGEIQVNNKDHKNSKLSFTFSHDVVKIITSQIEKSEKKFGAFNIACKENLSLFEFLQKFAGDNFIEKDLARAFYPSVECGYINIGLA